MNKKNPSKLSINNTHSKLKKHPRPIITVYTDTSVEAPHFMLLKEQAWM